MNKNLSKILEGRRNLFRSVEFPPLVWLIIVVILFSILSSKFIAGYNIALIARQVPVNGILSIALFLIVLVGGIDISIGSSLALYAVITGYMFYMKLPFVIIVILVPMIGMLFGYGIGALVTKLNIPELIVTLACQFLLRGLAIILGDKNFGPLPPEMKEFGNGSIAGIPITTLCFVAIAFAVAKVLHKNNFGKKVYAVGCNKQAASLAGINVPRLRRQLFMIEGALIGFAGIMYVANFGNVQPSWIGVNAVITLLAMVLLGGVNMNGGRGTVLGTCLGALLMTVIGNGIIIIKLNEYWVTFVTGLLILGALLIQYIQKKGLENTRGRQEVIK